MKSLSSLRATQNKSKYQVLIELVSAKFTKKSLLPSTEFLLQACIETKSINCQSQSKSCEEVLGAV
jgi:hypothetical protein